MRKPMKCKNCGKIDGPGEVDLSVHQNIYHQFPKGQYIFLCCACYRKLNQEVRYGNSPVCRV